MLGKLAADPRVAAIAWHVDYFNEPWKDPYSDPRHSAREAEYSRIYNREHNLDNPGILYLTPLIMVGGRQPLVGSNADAEARARAAITQSLRANQELLLSAQITLEGDQINAQIQLRQPPRTRPSDGECLVSLVLTEDRLANRVLEGELKNQQYLARYVARAAAFTPAPRPDAANPQTRATLRLAIPPGADPARLGLVLFAQDEHTGRILDARKLNLPRLAREDSPKTNPEP